MRALVTGSDGFVGRRMVTALQGRGYEVDGVDVATGCDARDVFSSPVTPPYDLVVHCAYHVGGRAAIDGLNTNFARNLELDAAMFAWAVTTGQKHVLYFSSSAVYPAAFQSRGRGKTTLIESDVDLDYPRLPDAGYGWAKLTGEMLAEDARRQGLPVTVVRPASGTSIHQDSCYPFPAIARRVAARETPLTLWGPPGQTRDWVHIDDVVNAALAIVDSGDERPVNIATGRGTTFEDLATMLWRRIHGNLKGLTIVNDETKPTGVFHRVLSPMLMLHHYIPAMSLEDIIDEAAVELARDAT